MVVLNLNIGNPGPDLTRRFFFYFGQSINFNVKPLSFVK